MKDNTNIFCFFIFLIFPSGLSSTHLYGCTLVCFQLVTLNWSKIVWHIFHHLVSKWWNIWFYYYCSLLVHNCRAVMCTPGYYSKIFTHWALYAVTLVSSGFSTYCRHAWWIGLFISHSHFVSACLFLLAVRPGGSGSRPGRNTCYFCSQVEIMYNVLVHCKQWQVLLASPVLVWEWS